MSNCVHFSTGLITLTQQSHLWLTPVKVGLYEKWTPARKTNSTAQSLQHHAQIASSLSWVTGGEGVVSELAFRYDFRVRLFNLSLKSGKPGVQRTTYRHPYCLPPIILTFNPLCSFNAISGWLCISDKETVLVVGQLQCHSSECNIHPGRKTSFVVSVTFGHHWHFGTHH